MCLTGFLACRLGYTPDHRCLCDIHLRLLCIMTSPWTSRESAPQEEVADTSCPSGGVKLTKFQPMANFFLYRGLIDPEKGTFSDPETYMPGRGQEGRTRGDPEAYLDPEGRARGRDLDPEERSRRLAYTRSTLRTSLYSISPDKVHI